MLTARDGLGDCLEDLAAAVVVYDGDAENEAATGRLLPERRVRGLRRKTQLHVDVPLLEYSDAVTPGQTFETTRALIQ
jgi:hypothetical protein